MRIRLDQPQPAFNDSYRNFHFLYSVKPKFSFRFYDTPIYEVHIYYFGKILLTRKLYDYFGCIDNFARKIQTSETVVFNENELLAFKWNFLVTVNDTDVPAKTTNVIQPNGKITLYFDNVSCTIS
ncbi:unnamed protein product [Schistosoma rodhaini]|uniref:Uncharacterized protein n=1 Tax=Schistosoma rodhaini TaxID=6188 RepID=A0AA85EIG5_9TREM|nr:unnamed protein product [Schistosoma rodhaini]